MKLYYYKNRDGVRNFGDELNLWLWPKIFSNILDEDPSILVTGIGTLLNTKMPRANKTIVLGSGAGYGDPPLVDDSWKIYWVRGPLTARLLKISDQDVLTDAAYLVLLCRKPEKKASFRFSFMPHVAQSRFGGIYWKAVCESLGFGYIDPQGEIEKVFERIEGTGCLITEALHGAILADAFRVPWIPVATNPETYGFKWMDWCASLNIRYRPSSLMPLWPASNDHHIHRAKLNLKLTLVRMQLLKIAKFNKSNLSSRDVHSIMIKGLEKRVSDFQFDCRSGLYEA